MPQVIEKGYLYIAVSPIFRVTEKINKEDKFHYFYNDKELEEWSKNHKNFSVSYIKGLGELQPQQLWDSTMDPTSRHMIKITIDDVKEASKVVELCMGNEVGPRKNFILNNANFLKVVD